MERGAGGKVLRSPDNFFVLFNPKDIVSGDFYWFAEAEGKTVMAVVDCTGHGVPGAFMSMIGNDLLNDIVLVRHITDPGKILSELDKGIRHALKQDETQTRDGMDIALAVIDFAKGQLHYAGAKNPLVYIQNNEFFTIKAGKMPVGGKEEESFKDKTFTTHTIEFTPIHCGEMFVRKDSRRSQSDSFGGEGLTFYLFTDGFQDQFGGEKGKKFMLGKMKELLLTIHQKPMAEQKEILNQIINSWRGNLEQVDDICVFGVRV